MRYLFLYWEVSLAVVAVLCLAATAGLLTSFVVVWLITSFEPSHVSLGAGAVVSVCLLFWFVRSLRN